MNIAVIGAGAAGYFAAISVKQHHPKAEVLLFEKSQQTLSKVRISGGGRCNATHACFSIGELSKAYPRGGKKLKKLFPRFNVTDTIHWFESRGVSLKAEEDGRMFPVSNSSESIIQCLQSELEKKKIKLKNKTHISGITKVNEKIQISFQDKDAVSMLVDKVIVTTGGSPSRKGLIWLEELGHRIVQPIPSLFTFNMPKNPIIQLMGLVAENALVSIQGTKLKSEGPLLITHWGMSGPAILKLSSFGARILSDLNYQFKIQVNWVNENNNERILEYLQNIIEKYPKRKLINQRPYLLPERLWIFLLSKMELSADKIWSDLGSKWLNKMVNILSNDIYEVNGKTTFKEEFVTCGGISLEDVDFNSMQSKVVKGLYFAGEILDIDAITGGYNFQAAWTTAYVAGMLKD